MPAIPRPNCEHLDNYRRCRVLHGQGIILRFLGLRPFCVLDRGYPPRDGEWTCSDQKPRPRPAPPTTPPPAPRKR